MAQTVTRTFPDGDYPTRLEQAWAAYEAARKDEEKGQHSDLYAGEELPSVVLAREYDALKKKAEADAKKKRRVVTLRALGRSKWRELKAKYPPRSGEGVDEETARTDRLSGINTTDVVDDLVFASIIDPKFTSRADYDEWADELSEGEFQLLAINAWNLVNGASVDPKSLPSSTTRSSETS